MPNAITQSSNGDAVSFLSSKVGVLNKTAFELSWKLSRNVSKISAMIPRQPPTQGIISSVSPNLSKGWDMKWYLQCGLPLSSYIRPNLKFTLLSGPWNPGCKVLIASLYLSWQVTCQWAIQWATNSLCSKTFFMIRHSQSARILLHK